MQAVAQVAPESKTMRWAGYALSALVVVFCIFDGISKVLQVAPVLEAQAQLGVPANLTVGIGLLLLLCVAVYLVPRTAVLGAVLLTGYLGGAVAIQARSGAPLFALVFPVMMGALVWGGLYLRDARLRALMPLRS